MNWRTENGPVATPVRSIIGGQLPRAIVASPRLGAHSRGAHDLQGPTHAGVARRIHLADRDVLGPRRQSEDATRRALHIADHEPIFAVISARSRVPWYLAGIIHYRECGLYFTRHPHNGDPLTERTLRVPAGRPAKGEPPFRFEDSAVDALH
jgi:hypothetical protein